ncbi:MAG: ABC transporter permease [Acidimicrobiales bacterium]
MTDLEIAALDAPASRSGLAQAVRAEWLKLFSLRSTFWTLLVTLAGSLLVTVLSTNGNGHHPRAYYQGFDPTNQSLTGLTIAVLSIGVLGALAATGEYGTGTIRSSLAAVPRRGVFYVAKLLVTGVVALVVGEVICFACFGVGQAVLAHGGAPTAALSDPGVLRALILSGAFLAMLGVGALALGVVVRHTAGALATYVGLTFLLPLLLQRLPSQPGRFTPILMLANSVAAVVHHGGAFGSGSPVGWGTGVVLMAFYAAVVVAGASVLLSRRDA